MSDYVPTICWRKLLGDPVDQLKSNLCWAVAMTRAFEALLKLNDMLRADQHLSIQETVHLGLQLNRDLKRQAKVDKTRFHSLFSKDGGLVQVEPVLDGLIRFGTVLDSDGPTLTFHRRARKLSESGMRYCLFRYEVYFIEDFFQKHGKTLGRKIYEEAIESLLALSPVMASMKISETAIYDPIYDPSPDDLIGKNSKHAHAVLLTKSGITDDNVPYWDYQDSHGGSVGDNGIRRVVKGKDLLLYVVAMQVKNKKRPRSP